MRLITRAKPSAGADATSADTAQQKSRRVPLIDALRGLAILAMVSYHLSWDLSWFAYVDWQVSSGPEWRSYAASIAGSFLFLSGVSLALAHGNGIRWRAFWKREAILVAAAAGVSVATYFTFGQAFVRFGILHCMAVGSLIALPFCRLPVLVTLATSALFAALPILAKSPVFDGDLWLWTGLGTPSTGAVDYVPLAPWTGLILAGLALTKIAKDSVFWIWLADFPVSGLSGRILRFLGQKSLIIYLLHQPLLYGAVWTVASVFGSPDRVVENFVSSCAANCTAIYDDRQACEAACRCTQGTLAESGHWQKLVEAPTDTSLREELNATYSQCLRDNPPALPPQTPSSERQ